MYTSPFVRDGGSERAWTEHIATDLGAVALLEAVRRVHLPDRIAATLDEILGALLAESAGDEGGAALPRPTRQAVHQFHLAGRYPDVVINDPRDRLFAVVEAQRGRADDRHIAKLVTSYIPRSGARLGILVAEGWRGASTGHPAWTECTVPVAVVVARDGSPEPEYDVAWVHHPTDLGGECGEPTFVGQHREG